MDWSQWYKGVEFSEDASEYYCEACGDLGFCPKCGCHLPINKAKHITNLPELNRYFEVHLPYAVNQSLMFCTCKPYVIAPESSFKENTRKLDEQTKRFKTL
jgi:hypothetical protein